MNDTETLALVATLVKRAEAAELQAADARRHALDLSKELHTTRVALFELLEAKHLVECSLDAVTRARNTASAYIRTIFLADSENLFLDEPMFRRSDMTYTASVNNVGNSRAWDNALVVIVTDTGMTREDAAAVLESWDENAPR